MRAFFTGLAAKWRLGRAAKLRRACEYERAIEVLSTNREVLAASPDLSSLSVRLMSLAALAELSAQEGRSQLARDALREWVQVWEDACQRAPGLAGVAEFKPWERWVRDRLARAKSGE